MLRRILSMMAVTLAALLVLVACGSPDETAEEAQVTRVPAEGAPTEAAQMPPEGTEPAGGAGEVAQASPAAGGEGAPAGGEGGGQIAEVTVEGYDIGWTQQEVTVTPGTTVTLVNTGAAGHNFEVTELGINVDMPVGETVTATIPEDAAPGTYEFICNIPGHEQAGMVGTLIVQAPGAAAAPASGGAAAPPADGAPAGGEQIAEVTIEGFDIGWTPTEVTVSPGTTVQLPNVGAAGHNFEVAELGINVDMPVGETVTATIPEDAAPGTYEFICNIPGHAPAGMVGTLIVQ